MGLMFSSSSFTGLISFSLRTSQLIADSYAFWGYTSHAPNTMSLRSARGTISLYFKYFFSAPSPTRMRSYWVMEPTGFASPLRVIKTPVMNVDDTAPRPTTNTPSLPSAFFTLLIFSCVSLNNVLCSLSGVVGLCRRLGNGLHNGWKGAALYTSLIFTASRRESGCFLKCENLLFG